MILYSWKKVYEQSGGSSRELVRIIYWLTYRPKFLIVEGNKLRFYHKVDWSGNSFLKNPEKLLSTANKYSIQDVSQYICLASLRGYGQYKLDHNLTLDLIRSPLEKDRLINNKLLLIKGEKIHFKWEV